MGMRLRGPAIREIRTLFSAGAMGSWTDGQILSQYLAEKEGNEAALRVLIQRHGPLVLGLCRRILGDEHAAEDAFQATFLVLVQKAEALRDCNLLTNWLYGVALRVAKKERAKTVRRRVVERQAARERTDWHDQEPGVAELRAVIDEEIQRMPEHFRVPLILCHLEGLRHEEVAQKLGCPVGTIESRLSRAREQLRVRLTRRGLAPTASALALAANPPDSSTAVTVASMIDRTVQAAIRLSSRGAGGPSAILAGLARRILGLYPPLHSGVLAATATACVGVVAAGLVAFRADQEQPRAHATTVDPPAIILPKSADPVATTNPETLKTREVASLVQPPAQPPRPNDEPPKPLTKKGRRPAFQPTEKPQRPDEPEKAPRASVVHAPALTGITIDGQLDDWPSAMPRYPIDKLLGVTGHLGTGGLKDADLSTSGDLSAAFSVGYDPAAQLVYLAVIVRDDKLVIGHTSPWDTDAVEVYIDGLHSERRIPIPSEEEFDRLELKDVPVQQYVAIPGKGRIYGVRQVTNPALMAGDVRKTRTRTAYNRKGDVTIYEWAIQVFDQYPDKPTKLEPGKKIGFEIAVVDKDVPATTEKGANELQSDRSAWIYWGPEWRGMKLVDSGALGTLILGK
jgi:RNA polymerase sigma factor (sigma-70 family)